MIGLSYRSADSQQELAKAIKFFENSLAGLIEGDLTDNVKPAPPTATAPLERGRERWSKLKPAFQDMVAQGRTDPFDLELIAEERDPLFDDVQSAQDALERYRDGKVAEGFKITFVEGAEAGGR